MDGSYLIYAGIGLILLSPLVRSLEHIAEGIRYMADVEAGALADLSAAVDSAVALINYILYTTSPEE